MMTKHPLNINLSREVFETCKENIVVKECYVNVFHTIGHFSDNFTNGKWKIAYGYIRILKDKNMFARHCFIVNENDEAIDPTLFTQVYFKENDEKEHYSFYIFEDIDDYLNEIENNNNMPDLIRPLMEIEKRTSDVWAKENHFMLIR